VVPLVRVGLLLLTGRPVASFLLVSPLCHHGADLTFGRRLALAHKEAKEASGPKVDLRHLVVRLVTVTKDTKDKVMGEGSNGKREEQVMGKAISNNQQRPDRMGMVIPMLMRNTTRECTSNSNNQDTSPPLLPLSISLHDTCTILTLELPWYAPNRCIAEKLEFGFVSPSLSLFLNRRVTPCRLTRGDVVLVYI